MAVTTDKPWQRKNVALSSLFSELFQLGVYKRSQGRIARQVTFAALAIVVALGGLAAERLLLARRRCD